MRVVDQRSWQFMNLAAVAEEIQHRVIHIFSRDEAGRRAVNGGNPKLNRDPHFRDYIHFYEVSWEENWMKDRADDSSSTVTMDEVLVPRTSVDGRDLLRGALCRRESSAVCRRRPRVSHWLHLFETGDQRLIGSAPIGREALLRRAHQHAERVCRGRLAVLCLQRGLAMGPGAG